MTTLRYTMTNSNTKIQRIRRQKGGGGLMVWGMVMPNGLIWVKEVGRSFKAQNYKDLLVSHAVPVMNLNFNKYVYVHDNARPHKAKLVEAYLHTLPYIDVLKWPAKSPDLNIIENVWKLMSDHVYANGQPENMTELRRRISQAVNEVNTNKRDVIINMFNNYRKRLIDVLNKRGNLL